MLKWLINCSLHHTLQTNWFSPGFQDIFGVGYCQRAVIFSNWTDNFVVHFVIILKMVKFNLESLDFWALLWCENLFNLNMNNENDSLNISKKKISILCGYKKNYRLMTSWKQRRFAPLVYIDHKCSPTIPRGYRDIAIFDDDNAGRLTTITALLRQSDPRHPYSLSSWDL